MLAILRFNFASPGGDPGVQGELLSAALELAQFGDRHGIAAISVDEHHVTGHGWSCNPVMIAGMFLARTANIFASIDCALGPLWNPIRMAEDIALIDAMSRGRLHTKAVTLSSRKWGRRGNVELVRLSYGRFGDELARSTGDEDLLSWAAEDLQTLFEVSEEPVDSRVVRWIDAMPQYGPGHAALVAELRDGLPRGLAVAGAYLDGIGVPACVASATRAVAALLTVGG